MSLVQKETPRVDDIAVLNEAVLSLAGVTAHNLCIAKIRWQSALQAGPTLDSASVTAGWAVSITMSGIVCTDNGSFFSGYTEVHLKDTPAGTANVRLTFAGNTTVTSAQIEEHSGLDTVAPLTAAKTTNTGTSTAPTVSVTTTDAICLISVAVVCDGLSSSTNIGLTSPGGGYTQTDVSQDATTSAAGEFDYLYVTSAGGQTATWGKTSAKEWAAGMVAYKAAVATTAAEGSVRPQRRIARRPGRGPYSRGVYRRPRVDAFTQIAGAIAGLASETDTALALLPIQILPAGMSTETDTALQLDVFTPAPLIDRVGSRLNRPGRGPYSMGRMFRPRVEAITGPQATAAGLASETDTALALLAVQLLPVGRSDESDTALALAGSAGSSAGRANETDSALALAGVQLRAVGQANETDTALARAGVQIRATGRADEADTAIALTPGSSSSAGLASETDSALAPQGKQLRPVGLATEDDAALAPSGVSVRPTGLASESDSSIALSPKQVRLVGRADETDTAIALSSSSGAGVGLASESESALALQGKQIRPVGLSTETEAALALTIVVARAVGTSTEVDVAFGLSALQKKPVGMATETDAAFALAVIGAFPTVPSAFYMYVVPGSDLTYVVPAP